MLFEDIIGEEVALIIAVILMIFTILVLFLALNTFCLDHCGCSLFYLLENIERI